MINIKRIVLFWFLLCFFLFSAVTEELKVKINFDNISLVEFVNFYGKMKKKPIILPDQFAGKVTVVSPNALSMDEAFKIFRLVLDSKGYTIIEEKDVVKILKKSNMLHRNLENFGWNLIFSIYNLVIGRFILLVYRYPCK